jgi:hypothetical protein
MTDLKEAAKRFESEHGCGSIGRCVICMADFARQQIAAAEQARDTVRDYWKQRCEAAERCIEAAPDAPDDIYEAWQNWVEADALGDNNEE